MRRNLGRALEQLENRRLLAVLAAVVGGDLQVTGTPDGPVEIVATGAQSIDVFDDGELVFTVEDVVDNLHVRFDDAANSADQTVELQLDGASIDRVLVDMGNGSNRLVLATGAIGGSLQFQGGNDDDQLEMSQDFLVGRSLQAFLGEGDNTADLRGTVNRSLDVRGGDGDDLIMLGEASEMRGGVNVRVGGGDNTLVLDGIIEGAFYFRGGDGDDLLDITSSAVIQGRTTLWMGGGDNSLNIDGTLESHLNASAGSGDDIVTLGENASLGGNARLRLGQGDNVVSNLGTVAGKIITDQPVETQVAKQALKEIAATLHLRELLDGHFEIIGTGHVV